MSNTSRSNAPGLRARKKAAMREAISNVATRLFIERGFDNVTITDIAAEADVSRLTVFNYFPRKEDLFFDREGEAEALIAAALANRATGEAPLTVLHRLVRTLIEHGHPFTRVTPGVVHFWNTVRKSPALSARGRELRNEFAEWLAKALAETIGRPGVDAHARLAADILVSTWIVAYGEALNRRARPGDTRAVLVELVERGFSGTAAALAGTPYI